MCALKILWNVDTILIGRLSSNASKTKFKAETSKSNILCKQHRLFQYTAPRNRFCSALKFGQPLPHEWTECWSYPIMLWAGVRRGAPPPVGTAWHPAAAGKCCNPGKKPSSHPPCTCSWWPPLSVPNYKLILNVPWLHCPQSNKYVCSFNKSFKTKYPTPRNALFVRSSRFLPPSNAHSHQSNVWA